MKKIAGLILFSLFLLASDFQPPVLDPMGVILSSALTTLGQESGVFYNPSLAIFNYPSLQYAQGAFTMDTKGLFSYLESKPSLEYSKLLELAHTTSYSLITRNFYISGRGGAMGYIYCKNLSAEGIEGENFSQENLDYRIDYKLRETKEIFFTKSYFLRKNKIFMGITTKYVFYKENHFSLPISDERNFEKIENLMEINEGEEKKGKRIALDIGMAGFLTPKIMLGISFLNLPISSGEKFSPEYILGAASYAIGRGLIFSIGSDLRNYKNRYFLSLLYDLKIVSLGAGIRDWDGARYYQIYGALRYKRFSLRGGLNLKNGEKTGFLFSLAITNGF